MPMSFVPVPCEVLRDCGRNGFCYRMIWMTMMNESAGWNMVRDPRDEQT